MCHMKKATIRELHLHTGSIVSEATEGRAITILKRGVPVAELGPIRPRPRSKGFGKKHWDRVAGLPKVPDSGRWLEKNR